MEATKFCSLGQVTNALYEVGGSIVGICDEEIKKIKKNKKAIVLLNSFQYLPGYGKLNPSKISKCYMFLKMLKSKVTLDIAPCRPGDTEINSARRFIFRFLFLWCFYFLYF